MIKTVNGGRPQKVDLDHEFIILYSIGTSPDSIIVQTELTDSRAEITVEFLNQKRLNQGLSAVYFWQEVTDEDREILEELMEE
jgi:hypothetical protein